MMTVGKWIETWLDLYVDPSALAKNTKLCYHRAAEKVLSSAPFVHTSLSMVSALDILPWLLEVARRTPRAAQLDRVMLSRAFTVAAKLGLCRPGIIDPDTCPKPVHEAKKALILDREQLLAYMAAASRTQVAPVLLLCCCGLRRGEALGVTWDSVDLDRQVVAVVAQRVADQLLPLKTKASRRVIAMPPQLVAVLRRWPRGSSWICDVSATSVYRVHRKILADLQLPPVTLHGLRHSFATAAVVGGQSVKLVQGALGHAHYAVTADVYADHLPAVSAVPASLFS